MVLQSGSPPYDYIHGKGRFRVQDPRPPNIWPVGPSGILLEQAQFVITAERRRWNYLSDPTILPSFKIYVHPSITPSGPYEPKTNGSTVANLLNPNYFIFTNNIEECRTAIIDLFGDISSDTDYDAFEYRAAWLQSLYPENPSGFLFAEDPVFNFNTLGHWAHRRPSQTGIINYNLLDVLGSSGIIYDIDIGEIMFNPPPHISTVSYDTAHGTLANGGEDTFNIQLEPFFPAFQKTNGNIITLTGREPVILKNHDGYRTIHIASGYIALNGYCIKGNTKIYLGRNANIFDVSQPTDFTVIEESLRQFSQAGTLVTSRLFLDSKAQSSGVYRAAAVNKFADFPTTTIQSGTMSFWPRPEFYWPNGIVGSTTTTSNLGYHVFDDAIWMLDRSIGGSTRVPSGLAILSPFTGHRLWVRYADPTPISVTVLGTTTTNLGWPKLNGLERNTPNSIYRIIPTVQTSVTNVSGQVVFGKYNDNLDLIDTITTLSTVTHQNDEFSLGGDVNSYHDMWFDGTNYWVSNNEFTGFDLWKFDSSFDFVEKYVVNTPTGIFQARGAHVNGKHVLYFGWLSTTFTNPIGGNGGGSGLFPVNITDSANPAGGVPGNYDISYSTGKYINGAPFVGLKDSAEIMDVLEVTSSSHVIPGIYVLIRWKFGTSPFNDGDLYLLRIEEQSTSWEIAAYTMLETNVAPAVGRREILFMDY